MNISASDKSITVALVGNPNSGKTSLYNCLTRSKGSVANYPRVTVEKHESLIEYKGWKINIVDLPGIYSMTSRSPEERVGRDFIQDEQPDIILNILDAGNLERNLFLTTQTIETGRPHIFALNMVDEMRAQGISIDLDDFGKMLGGPVVETIANKKVGVDKLLDTIVAVAEEKIITKNIKISYDDHLEEAIETSTNQVHNIHPDTLTEEQSRWLAIKLLEGDEEFLQRESDHDNLIKAVRVESESLAIMHSESTDSMFATARYGFIHGLMSEVSEAVLDPVTRMKTTKMLDGLFLNQLLGLPIFLGLMYLMFEATFTLGEGPMDMIDAMVGSISDSLDSVLSPGLMRDLIIDGIIAGVGGTIIFLPNIVILFLFMALFSETGYLTRASFLVDRLMHSFGMHGKAFIPLVMGFGCNVPAVMATRTIESNRARLIAILVTPFMSCAARLPVFILFAGAFFAENAGTIVFLMYMLSIVAAMAMAVFLGKVVIRGENEPFVMELPPYRMPTLSGIVLHMWEKAVEFLKKVGGVILIGSIIIWFLQAFPQNVEYSKDYEAEIATLTEQGDKQSEIVQLERSQAQEQMQKSYLGQIGMAVAPVFAPMDFGWKDTVAILTGFVAKEVVVATYAVLYSQDGEADAEDEGLRTVIAGSMPPATAFAFMIFILLYAPCLATIAAIKREAGGWKWAIFSAVFSTIVAYVFAMIAMGVGSSLV